MPSSHLILCCPLLLLPPIPPSIRVFSNELTLHMRWAKYWSFSFSIIPSKEHPGLISFRIDWLDLLAVQGTLKSLLQHHSSEACATHQRPLMSKNPLPQYINHGECSYISCSSVVLKQICIVKVVQNVKLKNVAVYVDDQCHRVSISDINDLCHRHRHVSVIDNFKGK